MRPFDVPRTLDSVTDPFPSPDLLLSTIQAGGKLGRTSLAQLWLSEGIPFAFKSRPGVFDALRNWLGQQLHIHAKSITVVGSARIGFSMSGKDYGRSFGPSSDLDLAAVSLVLFSRLETAFQRWAADYSAGRSTPKSNIEKGYWDENLEVGRRGIRRGFVDANKIPLRDAYPDAKAIAQALYLAHMKLRRTEAAPPLRRVSLRVYRDWDSFVDQVSRSLVWL